MSNGSKLRGNLGLPLTIFCIQRGTSELVAVGADAPRRKAKSVPVDRSTWDFTSFARDLSDESKLEMDSS